MGITIKKAVLEDLADVAGLFDCYRVFYKQESDVESARFFIAKRMNKEDSVIFLARSETGQAVGFTQLYPTFSSQSMQRMWILNDLYVTESHREAGIGSILLETARYFSADTTSKGLLLCTQVTNQKAQALYRRSGYRKLDEFEWYFLKT